MYETTEVINRSSEEIQKRYQQAKVDTEQKQYEEYAKLIKLIEKLGQQITIINQTAIISHPLTLGDYFKNLCKIEEGISNFTTKTEIYKQLSDETFLKTLVKSSEDAPSLVDNPESLEKEK